MSIVALVVWVITAGFGSFMARIWISHGGLPGKGSSHLPAVRVFSHLGLAVTGLIVWIIYVVTDIGVLAWIAFALLVLAAVLGGLLFRRWSVDGRAAMGGRGGPGADLAEQHIGRVPVVLHGIFAVSTAVLVLLAAVGVGS